MPGVAEFNYHDFQNSAQEEQDKKLLVRFFIKQRQDSQKSKEEGRPIFKDVEYIDIKIPGNRTGGACRPATYQDKQRFPRHYEAFKKRQEAPEEGTPLTEWPMITRSQAEEMAFFHVKTVEQLADMSDANLAHFMNGQTLKTKARIYLEESTETARVAEIEDLKNNNLALQEQLETMQKTILEMKKTSETTAKKRTTRKKKTE